MQGGQTVEETMKLQDILKVIKRRLLLIITLTIIAVGIASFISFYMQTPIYKAQTQILVNQNNTSEETYSRSQIETDLQFINTYHDIVTSPVILDKVIGKLQLNTTPEQLAYQITLYSENGSKVLYIEVLDSDPVLAVDIANTTAEVFKEEIPNLMKVDNINIISVAKFNEDTSPVSPNKVRNIAIGAVMGIMIGVGLAFLFEILDTTIKGEKDVEEILNLPIMGLVGSIPVEKGKKASSKTQRVRGIQNARLEK